MLDINLLRTNPELVKENIRKKFQDEKLVIKREFQLLGEMARIRKIVTKKLNFRT